MEDRGLTAAIPGGFVVAVFDGHGGAHVAEHACRHVVPAVTAALDASADLETMWRSVFAAVDVEVAGCGSTATVVLVRAADVSAAWVGDSRAVLAARSGSRVLTPDHRITRDDERARVVAAGAVLEPPYVVDRRTGDGLMVTRSLGDRHLRGVGVIAEPEIRTVERRDDDLALIVATDGLWDVVDTDEAATIGRAAPADLAAAELLDLAVRRHTSDNTTVVVVRLHAGAAELVQHERVVD